jgi:hypothetical protein
MGKGGSDDSESKLGDFSNGLGLLTNIEDPKFGCCCTGTRGGGYGILIPLESAFDPAMDLKNTI